MSLINAYHAQILSDHGQVHQYTCFDAFDAFVPTLMNDWQFLKDFDGIIDGLTNRAVTKATNNGNTFAWIDWPRIEDYGKIFKPAVKRTFKILKMRYRVSDNDLKKFIVFDWTIWDLNHISYFNKNLRKQLNDALASHAVNYLKQVGYKAKYHPLTYYDPEYIELDWN